MQEVHTNNSTLSRSVSADFAISSPVKIMFLFIKNRYYIHNLELGAYIAIQIFLFRHLNERRL
jgi:hypothetical protein